MYWGSVKFFKDLIIISVITVLTLSVGFAIFFGVKYFRLRDIIAVTTSSNPPADKSNEEEHAEKTESISELYDRFKSSGMTDTEILDYIKTQNPEAFDGYIAELEEYKNSPEYAKKYPELYVAPAAETSIKDNTIYLTFDDGPTENTLSILSILDKYDIKATFFMSGSETPEGMAIMKEVADRGHTIGIHSISHDYTVIYDSPDAFLTDMQNTSDNIYEATGVKPDILRFAGGSVNDYNKDFSAELIKEVERRGYAYFDWNVSAQDASKNATWTTAYNNVTKGVDGRNNAIVLLHNNKVSLLVTEDIILALKAKGYEFDRLTAETTPTHFVIPVNEDITE